MAIAELRGVQLRALAGIEQAAERGQAERRLTAPERGKRDGECLPEVGVAVGCAAAHGAFAQPGERVAGEVACLGLVAGSGREHEALAAAAVAPVLDGGKEDEAVDEAQQLLEEGLPVVGALGVLQGAAQRRVGRVRQEPGAQLAQGLGDLVAQPAAHGDAGLLAGGAPVLPGAVGRRRIGRAEAAGVGEQPEGAEVGEQFLLEDRFEVDLDIGGARQAGVVAQDAQHEAVADDGPERRVARVERLLRQHEGAAAAGAAGVGVGFAEALGGGIQRLVEASKHQRHPAGECGVTDGVVAAGLPDGRARRSVGKVQHVAHERQQPLAYGDLVRLHVPALAQAAEILPERQRDLEVTRDLVAQLQALGDAVVRLGLLAGLGVGQQGQARQLLGRNQAALDADGAVGELMRETLGHAGQGSVDAHAPRSRLRAMV